ncbi:MAG: ABC transporter ATP-binding protein [Desulfobulbaceae bacterium]|uniref:ABC transporter ATP-binding protein n=1 Tax=Candidatus Desulfatifera sulfidica TaxID=2841691 RepID=A0A8J6T9A4_9BACT|nr:ABC transporter ATP-binding protein [Candidatus Desulfatifera sulfidica]
MTTPLLEALNIRHTYTGGTSPIDILKGVNVQLEAGEMLAIVGASGSGKTTLLQILGTLSQPSSGELRFKGDTLKGRSDQKIATFRNRELGFIFQFHHLLPEFSALENVIMPGLINGQSHKELLEPAREILEQVNLSHRLDHRVGQLSGGEQQRTALARALIMEPTLLLADEPTGNLDSRSGRLVFDLIGRLCRERKMAVVMVTHNMELAAEMDRRLTLIDGLLLDD